MAAETTGGGPRADRPRARLRRRILFAILFALVAYFGISLVVANFDEVANAADLVSHPQLGWLSIAIAVEAVSYVTYAGGLRRLLTTHGHRLGLPRLSLLAVAAQALGALLPGGYAWGNVYAYRVLRGWGIDEVTAGRVLFVSVGLYVGALALLAVPAGQFAGSNGPVHDVDLAAYTLLGILAVIAAAVLLRPRQLRSLSLGLLEWLALRLGRRNASAAERVERLRDELAHATELGPRTLAIAGGWMLVAWLGDVGCLAAAFAAVGATPPWQGLLLAYCGAQLAALLPITPGGLGVVEGSLTLALVSYGGGQEATVAAVLLYRLISFWGLIPAGAISWALLRTRRLRAAEVAA